MLVNNMNLTLEEQFEEHIINKFGINSKDLSEASQSVYDKELERFMSDHRAYNEEWKDE